MSLNIDTNTQISCPSGSLFLLLLLAAASVVAAQADVPQGNTVTPWAQCDKCLKWRRMPWHIDPEQLPQFWVCADNVYDPERASCDVSK